jgi:cytochrome c biogenesis protein CcmG/thiol:disulfide interchange protein DsbE
LVLVPALAFLGLLGAAVLKEGGLPEPGDSAPAFEAPLLGDDRTLALADLEGKPVLINFWASWCVPCKEEAPMLKRAYETYGDRIEFVGVVVNDAEPDAIAFADRYGMDWPSVRDLDRAIFDDYGLTGQPETFFIDGDGTIVEHVNGPLFEDELLSLLDSLVSRG